MQRLLRMLGLACSLAATACMNLPEGVHIHVTDSGCTTEMDCPYGRPGNFYWAPLRQVVVMPGQGERTVMHELCHAHQHQVILEELGREPALDLREWYGTSEGQSFSALAAEHPPPWAWLSALTPLEDFANTCALWNVDPDELRKRDPARWEWMKENLR